MKDFRLKADIFETLKLPFKLEHSSIRKVIIDVPLASIGSSPVEIVLESVDLTISTLDPDQLLFENTWDYEHKKVLLDKVVNDIAS